MLDMHILVAALFVLMVVQAVGTHIQVRQYKKAVRRLHQKGNVGIGSKKGRLRPGNIVAIACDKEGKITGGEILEGYTIFNQFKEMQGIAGKTIYDLKAEYSALPDKKRKLHQAHLQALEALQLRLHPMVKE